MALARASERACYPTTAAGYLHSSIDSWTRSSPNTIERGVKRVGADLGRLGPLGEVGLCAT